MKEGSFIFSLENNPPVSSSWLEVMHAVDAMYQQFDVTCYL